MLTCIATVAPSRERHFQQECQDKHMTSSRFQTTLPCLYNHHWLQQRCSTDEAFAVDQLRTLQQLGYAIRAPLPLHATWAPLAIGGQAQNGLSAAVTPAAEQPPSAPSPPPLNHGRRASAGAHDDAHSLWGSQRAAVPHGAGARFASRLGRVFIVLMPQPRPP